jgi:hypothetical protein
LGLSTHRGGIIVSALDLEELLEDGNTDVIEFGLEIIDKLVQTIVHDFLNVEKLQFGS